MKFFFGLVVMMTLMLSSQKSLAGAPSCEKLFSYQKNYTVFNSLFNAIYKFKTPKLVKKFEQHEYDAYLNSLRNNEEVIPSKPEHLVAMIDYRSAFHIRKFNELDPLSKKHLVKAVKSYFEAKIKSDQSAKDISHILVKDTLPRPVSILSILKGKKFEEMRSDIFNEHIEYFLLLENMSQVFRTDIVESQSGWARLRRFVNDRTMSLRLGYREHKVYVGAIVNYSIQFTFSALHMVALPFLPDINVRNIPDFQRRLEAGLYAPETDAAVQNYLKSDFEYRYVQAIGNTIFWSSLLGSFF